MVTQRRPKPKDTPKDRDPIGSDFGNYLRTLRVERNLTTKDIAAGLHLKFKTIENIEAGVHCPPRPERLKLWLKIMGCSDKIPEALRFLASVRTSRNLKYFPRNPANEHIDRLIDAYESDRLSPADLCLLRMIAPGEYGESAREKPS
jgi:transcriptional regulator with XRE-family HTH domain